MPHGPVFAFALGIVSILTPCCVRLLPTLIHLHPSLPPLFPSSLRLPPFAFGSILTSRRAPNLLRPSLLSFFPFHPPVLFPQITHYSMFASFPHPSHLVPLRVQARYSRVLPVRLGIINP
ncbi:hypothetical protein B0H16DRAFT_1543371 [Mycena metata]|uniref:Uncharacterized protein n=1 Tax=Mycena metata TaxID=1033252 RepID=A0AAD7J094_9AGAR|nr:hypothetical protein B0H16DRAFT_1543371 [Mycena metata]